MRLQLDALPIIASRSVPPRRFQTAKWHSCACVVAAMVGLTGCRSSMPGMGMFGFKSEPSADALAGVGPTATYPISPSAGISPEAIASTAAGTTAPSGLKPQTGSFASASPSLTQPTSGMTAPGTAAQAPNQAAASANGFYGNTAPSRSLTASPASYANAAGAGYTYGQNPAASKSTSPVNSSGGINAIAAGYIPAARSTADSESIPAYAQAADAAPATTPPTAYAASTGYPLPGASVPSSSAPVASSTDAGYAMPPIASTAEAAKPASLPGGFAMPSVAAPTPSTAVASTPSTSGPAAYQASVPTSPSAPTAPSTGYTPGSTAGAVGYPSSGGYPATGSSDSFYR